MLSVASPIHRLDVDDVLRMVEAGIIDEHARVELVQGVLVDMQPIGPQHDAVLARLVQHTVRHSGLTPRVQSMLLTPDGYVVPDLSLTDPLPDDEHPRTARLVVELAQTSHARDEEKIAVYAGLGVPEYWIVDLKARCVRVLRDPRRDGYASEEVVQPGAAIAPLVTEIPPLDVAWLLGA